MPALRDHKLTILLTADEDAALKRIAEADGLTASDVVRQYIRRRDAETGGKPAHKGGRK